MSPEELRRSYGRSAAMTLARVVAILGDRSQRSQPVTRDSFAATVAAMHERLGRSARAHGRAMMKALDCLEHGREREAIEVYRRFLGTCPSEYFRRMARAEIAAIAAGRRKPPLIPEGAPMDEFAHLTKWSELPDDELAKSCSDGSMAILERLAHAYGDEECRATPITARNFVTIVRAMEKLRRDGSIALSRAMQDVKRYLQRGKTEQAIDRYERFLRSCPSELYRRIARGELGEIQRQSVKSSK